MNGRAKTALVNTAMLYLLTVAKMVFPLILLPFLTRSLTVECYGVVAYVRAIMTYFQLFVDFGFMYSAVRLIVKETGNNQRINQIVADTVLAKMLLVAIGAFVMIGLVFAIDILRDYVIYVVLSFLAIAMSCFFFDFYFRGIEKMQFITIVFVFTKTVSTALTVMFVSCDADMVLIPIFDIIGSLVSVAIGWGIAKTQGFNLVVPCLKSAVLEIKESAVIFANTIATTTLNSFSTIVIGIMVSDLGQVAFWSVSIQLMGAVQALYSPICNGFFPYMIREKSLKLLLKITFSLLPIVVLGTVLCFFLSENILVLFGGKEYAKAAPIFCMLLPVLVTSFPVAMLGYTALGVIGKDALITKSSIIAALLQIVGVVCLVVTGFFSIVAVAVIRNLSEVVMLLSRCYSVWMHKNLFKE